MSVNRVKILYDKPPDFASLRALRKALGLTVQNCADMVHVSKSSWSRWESTDEFYRSPMSMMAWDLFWMKTREARSDLQKVIDKLEKDGM